MSVYKINIFLTNPCFSFCSCIRKYSIHEYLTINSFMTFVTGKSLENTPRRGTFNMAHVFRSELNEKP